MFGGLALRLAAARQPAVCDAVPEADAPHLLARLCCREGGLGSRQLAALVEQLGKGLRRILRKYKTLAGHLHDSQDSSGGDYPLHQHHQHQHQHEPHAYARRRHHQPAPCHQPAHSGEGQEVSSIDEGGGRGGGTCASQASSWAIGAGRHSGGSAADPSSAYGGAASEAMAEAGRKAASIAAKLDRLLTPQSRAAVHGGGGVGWTSRFATGEVGGEAQAEEVEEEPGHYGRPHQQQLWPAPAGDPEEVPLRQRFGSAPPF